MGRVISRFLLIALLLAAAASAEAYAYCPYKLVTYRTQAGGLGYALAQGREARPKAAIDVTPAILLASSGGADRAAFYSVNLNRFLGGIQCRIEASPVDYAAYAVELSPASIAPAIPEPRNVVAMGLNHKAHAAEVGRTGADGFIFSKNVAMTGAYDAIVRPALSLLDYEVEIGVVIRKEIAPGTEITPENVREYVAGFVLANDVSNRALILMENGDGRFTTAKTHPTFLPVGPYFAPIENFEIAAGAFLPKLAMTTKVTDPATGEVELRQDATSDEADFFVNLAGAVRIALEKRDLSDFGWDRERQTILRNGKFEAGDLLLMGTVNGVALRLTEAVGRGIVIGALTNPNAFNPKPAFWPQYEFFFRDSAIPGGYNYGGPSPMNRMEKWMQSKLHLVLHEYCKVKDYVRAGQVISAAIEALGEQENSVVADAADPLTAAESETLADSARLAEFCGPFPPVN